MAFSYDPNNITSIVYNLKSGKEYPNIVNFGESFTWAKPYTLLLFPQVPGIESLTVVRTSSVRTDASLNSSLNSNSTIYYNDTLKATAVLEKGYKDLELVWKDSNNNEYKTDIISNIASNMKIYAYCKQKPMFLYYPAITNEILNYRLIVTTRATASTQVVTSPNTSGMFNIGGGDSITVEAITIPSGYINPRIVLIDINDNETDLIKQTTGEYFGECYEASYLGFYPRKQTSTFSNIKYKTYTQTPTNGFYTLSGTYNYSDYFTLPSGTKVADYVDCLSTDVTLNTNTFTVLLKVPEESTVGGVTIEDIFNDTSFNIGFIYEYSVISAHPKLTYPATPYGAEYTIKRNGSTIISNPSSAGTYKLVHGDKLTAAASPLNTIYWNDPIVNWSGDKEVDGDITYTISHNPKSYSLTKTIVGNGVNTHTVLRTDSPYKGASKDVLANNATIYYGDVLSASVTNKTGYSGAYVDWSSTTVTGNITSVANTGKVREFTLYKETRTPGIATHVVERTSSPLKGASTGELSNGATIYYNDTLTQTATAATNYSEPSIDWISKTVTGDVDATATPGRPLYVTLSYPATPANSSYYIICQEEGSTSTTEILKNPSSAGSISVPYGAHLIVESSAAAGYTLNFNWTDRYATQDLELTVNYVIASFTLTKYTGANVESHTVKRTSSPIGGASTTYLYDGDTIYYNDELTQSAAPSTGYRLNDYWTSKTVTGDVTASVTASEKGVLFTLDDTPIIYEVSSGTTWRLFASSDDWPYSSNYYVNESGMLSPLIEAAQNGYYVLDSNGYPIFADNAIEDGDYYVGIPKD